MDINERKEYAEKISDMNRYKLIKECLKLKKRLDKLSGICDIEDTYRIMQENVELNRKVAHADRALDVAKEELDKLGVRYDNREKIDVLTKLLIDSLRK